MSEASPGPEAEQASAAPSLRWTRADALTALRLPMALAFVLVDDAGWRLVLLVAAGVSDLVDGQLARRYGGSAVGAILDPVADKLFMLAAFAVVLLSGRLHTGEVLFALLRDIVASAFFVVTTLLGRTTTVPARWSGKLVTVAQMATLFAFLVGLPFLRPLAWLTGGLAAWALLDYLAGVRRVRAA